MFRRACIVADYMYHSTKEGDIILLFDADYVPYRHKRSLDTWAKKLQVPQRLSAAESLSEQTPIDFVVYDRGHLDEIAAGSYFARSSPKMIRFLMDWSRYDYRVPPGFSSADNGAIHIHLLRSLGIEPEEGGVCGKLYSNLTASVDNLQPYQEYLKCCRKSGLQIGMHRHADHPREQFSGTVCFLFTIQNVLLAGKTHLHPFYINYL